MIDDVDILDWFIAGALKTESKDINAIGARLTDPVFFSTFVEILSDIIKLGQKVDKAKKHLYYGAQDSIPKSSSIREFPEEVLNRVDNEFMIRMLHGVFGLVSEAGELAEAIKKVVFQNVPIDYVNMGEELGDAAWYMAVISSALEKASGISLQEWLQRNIAKLEERYPDKFKRTSALNRDIGKERKKLKGE